EEPHRGEVRRAPRHRPALDPADAEDLTEELLEAPPLPTDEVVDELGRERRRERRLPAREELLQGLGGGHRPASSASAAAARRRRARYTPSATPPSATPPITIHPSRPAPAI